MNSVEIDIQRRTVEAFIDSILDRYEVSEADRPQHYKAIVEDIQRLFGSMY